MLRIRRSGARQPQHWVCLPETSPSAPKRPGHHGEGRLPHAGASATRCQLWVRAPGEPTWGQTSPHPVTQTGTSASPSLRPHL